MTRVTAAVAAAVLVAVLAIVLVRDGPSVGSALAVLEDDVRFTTTRRAAEAFIEASVILQETATACAADENGDAPACSSVFQASAYAQVLAFEVVDCTLPGVHDARQAMIGYLRDVDRATHDPVPEPPPLPDC